MLFPYCKFGFPKTRRAMKKYIAALLFFSSLAYQWAGAQNSTANLGSPLINLTFGAGPNFAQPLAPGTTGLTYAPTTCTAADNYTISTPSPTSPLNHCPQTPPPHPA